MIRREGFGSVPRAWQYRRGTGVSAPYVFNVEDANFIPSLGQRPWECGPTQDRSAEWNERDE